MVLATLLWPVNRWVMGRGGRPEAFGLATAVTAALISSPLALASGQSLADPVVWSVGAVIGLAFAVGYFMLVAVLVLTVILCRRGRLSLSRLELGGGAVNGLISAAAMVTTLLSLRHLRAEIVFPVTVALPILLVLLLSAAVYRERLTVLSWAACVTGGAGLVVLTLSQ